MRALVFVFVHGMLLAGAVAQAASYQTTDGLTVDPILDYFLLTAHPYSGPDLEPNANLYGANLTGADLFGADLSDAELTGANLSWTQLRSADLTGANLFSINLSRATLADAKFDYADLGSAELLLADLWGASLYDANLEYAYMKYANLTNADLSYADLNFAELSNASLFNADLVDVELGDAYLYYTDLFGANLDGALYLEYTTGSPYYYTNTTLPSGFDPVAQGWNLTPHCDFTPDGNCNGRDLDQMFQAGNLVNGVGIGWGETTDRMDLSDNDTIDAADITEWLAQAAAENGHSSPYLRGDADLDHNVDLTDYSALANNFDPPVAASQPCGSTATPTATTTSIWQTTICWRATFPQPATVRRRFQNRHPCACWSQACCYSAVQGFTGHRASDDKRWTPGPTGH